jgi:hypothetical protein
MPCRPDQKDPLMRTLVLNAGYEPLAVVSLGLHLWEGRSRSCDFVYAHTG